MTEEWKDIPGYEGMYQVSNLGNVKGLNRKDSRGRLREEKILKPLKHYKGYRSIHLHKEGNCKTAKIHRLVAQAFLPEYSEILQVDHINGARDCNLVENLRMVTNSENKMNMKKIIGLSSKYKGVHWHKATSRWAASIKINGTCKYIGLYATEAEAAKVYDLEAYHLFGKFARTNESMGLFNESLG